jgi:hypothetical protein
MAEPLGFNRWKTVRQQRVDKLATFLSTEPKTTLRATRRTAYIQQLQRAVETRHQWASAVVDHLAAVKDLLEQGTAGATGTTTKPSVAHSGSSRKSGALGS